MNTLDAIIRDMEKKINSAKKSKRLVAQLKVRLKKEVIEEYQQQLDSTLQLLSFSHQIYLGALIRAQPAIIMSEWKAWYEAKYQEGISGDLAKDEENEERQLFYFNWIATNFTLTADAKEPIFVAYCQANSLAERWDLGKYILSSL
ncbi:hypothetical protein NW759_004900 [Fusarium solani]|nr:hypothetical protein NW759_004900 [Fusarium solani]